MKTLGIIPAAGKAERFGGILKELLPARNGITFLLNTIMAMPEGCQIAVVTNSEKIEAHARELGTGVIYVIQEGEGLMGAVYTAMDIKADRYYFAMPDTEIDPSISSIFQSEDKYNLSIGTFLTNKPHKYGILCNTLDKDFKRHFIKDKPDLKMNIPCIAWGALSWSNKVRRLWIENRNSYSCFTDMINDAIHRFGYLIKENIFSYHDMATIKDYKDYLCS